MTRATKAHVERFDEPLEKPFVQEMQVYLLITEEEAIEMAGGKLPDGVKEQARMAVDWRIDTSQRPRMLFP